MTNDVWITFNKGVPSDVYLSKDTAEKHKFHSETVQHFIHVTTGVSKDLTREALLEQANAELRRQVEELTRLLEKSEKRMMVLEQLGGVPMALRTKRRATA